MDFSVDPSATRPALPHSPQPKPPVKVLIIEDELLIAIRTKMDLARLGFQVCTLATSGREAIRVVQNESPDVLLVDIGLVGDLNGIETVQQIRSFSGAPAIFVSGCLDDYLIAQAVKLQPADFLSKPAQPAMIENAIQSLLSPGH